MKVETFELTDVSQETEQQSAEAIRLCTELGLQGQLKKDETTQVVTRIPYRLMTDEENFVYSVLCPEKTEVSRYSNEPIPLEILKTLAYAKSLDHFQEFEVWSASSKTVKDPVLVGHITKYASQHYIIARWGEELLPIQVLLPDAIKKYWSRRRQELMKIAKDVARALDESCPEVCPDSVRIPSFYL